MKIAKKLPYVSIIVPAYNEERNIEKILKSISQIKEYRKQVIVAIDSKTTDRTAEKSKKYKPEILLTTGTVGKGDVISQAIKRIKGDYAIQIDADSQFLPSDIPKLIEPLINGVDVTLGTRYQKGANVEKGSVTKSKLVGSYFLSFMTTLLCGVPVTDVMAGFKAFKSPLLKRLHPEVSHFGYEAELVIKAAKLDAVIQNVPITYKKRIIGKSTVNDIKHGLLVLGTIFKTSLN